MTIKEIAAALKFSTTTVSVCLAGRENDPRYCIKHENAERIRAFASEHGYVPDAAARRLRAGDSTPPVGLLFPETSGLEKIFPAFRQVIDILSKNNREYQIICYTPRKMAKALEFLRSLRVRDVIVLGTLQEPCPVYHPSRLYRLDAASSRNVDEYLADWHACEKRLAEMTLYATDYIFPAPATGGIKHGLIRMGTHLNDFVRMTIRRINNAGLGPVAVACWTNHEIEMVPELLACPEHIIKLNRHGSRFTEGRRVGELLLALRRKHYFRTAFFGNDGIAAGIIAELTEHGVRVPEDIAVLGFGNDEASSYFRVPLSTFDSCLAHNACIAAEAIIRGKQLSPNIYTTYQFIQRKSFVYPEDPLRNSPSGS